MSITSQVFHDKFYLSLQNQLPIYVLGTFFLCLVLGELTLYLHMYASCFCFFSMFIFFIYVTWYVIVALYFPVVLSVFKFFIVLFHRLCLL